MWGFPTSGGYSFKSIPNQIDKRYYKQGYIPKVKNLVLKNWCESQENWNFFFKFGDNFSKELLNYSLLSKIFTKIYSNDILQRFMWRFMTKALESFEEFEFGNNFFEVLLLVFLTKCLQRYIQTIYCNDLCEDWWQESFEEFVDNFLNKLLAQIVQKKL